VCVDQWVNGQVHLVNGFHTEGEAVQLLGYTFAQAVDILNDALEEERNRD
jgi:hypothetical protein